MNWLGSRVIDGTVIAILVNKLVWPLLTKLAGSILYYTATKLGEDAVIGYLHAHGHKKTKPSQ